MELKIDVVSRIHLYQATRRINRVLHQSVTQDASYSPYAYNIPQQQTAVLLRSIKHDRICMWGLRRLEISTTLYSTCGGIPSQSRNATLLNQSPPEQARANTTQDTQVTRSQAAFLSSKQTRATGCMLPTVTIRSTGGRLRISHHRPRLMKTTKSGYPVPGMSQNITLVKKNDMT